MEADTRRLLGVLGGVLGGAVLVGVLAVQDVDLEPARRTRPSPAPRAAVAGAVQAGYTSPAVGLSGDDLVRLAAAEVSDHPLLEALLADEDLPGRLVAAVDDLAAGRLPAAAAALAPPRNEVLVWRNEDGRMLVAPGTQGRYTGLVEVLTSLDPGQLSRVYDRLHPELEAAYRALPGAQGSFEERLREALARLRSVPAPAGPVEVERRGWRWVLADPALAALTPAEQQLVLMGAGHARRVHAALDAIAEALGWPEVAAPAPVLVAAVQPPAPADPAVPEEAPVVLAQGGEPAPATVALGAPLRTSEMP